MVVVGTDDNVGRLVEDGALTSIDDVGSSKTKPNHSYQYCGAVIVVRPDRSIVPPDVARTRWWFVF